MKIISLEAQNIKKLKAVSITPDPNGNMVVIGGNNGNGKTSVLDSIWYALGGKRAIQDKPVREGEALGTIRLELDGDFVIERKIAPDGRTELTVTDKQGGRYGSPQKLLDSLVAKFTFDPLEFSSMEPKDQVQILKQLVGIDFAPIDRKKATLADERTFTNRRLKELEGSLATLPEAGENLPKEEIPTDELLRVSRENQSQAIRIATLNNDIKQRKAAIEAQMEALSACEQEYLALTKMPVVDVQEKLLEIQKINEQIRAAFHRRSLEKEANSLFTKAKELTDEISGIEKHKKEIMETAPFPVQGLSFDENVVSYNEIPFNQLSGAEKLKISSLIGLALNPQLKILLIRDGSLLDDANLLLLGEIAKESDAQVWLERVGKGSEVSVVLEDGEVSEVRRSTVCEPENEGEYYVEALVYE